MANYDIIEDYNTYHGIKTKWGGMGMHKAECSTCDGWGKCVKKAPWDKSCEKEMALDQILGDER